MKAELSREALELAGRIEDKAGLLAALAETLTEENHTTAAHIQEDYLSGPTGEHTLSVRSGLLRASVNVAASVVEGSVINGGIGSPVIYAAAHEFGVDKMVKVKEHARRQAIDDRFHVIGGGDVDRFTALRMGILSKHQVSKGVFKAGHYEFAERGAARVVKGEVKQVAAGERHMKLPERAMFRTGIADRLADLGKALSDAVVSFWKGGHR